MLWEVTAKDGRNKAFLFGTIHVGKPSFYPLPNNAQGALVASSKIVVEADVTDETDAAEIARLVEYPQGQTLATHLDPALLVRLKAQLEKRRLAYANVATLRPVLVGGMLPVVEYVKLGYDMKSGLDLHLIQLAKREKKPLLQLESPLEQMKFLTAIAQPLQEAFLENAITELEQDRSAEQVTGIVNAWQLGDPKLLVEVAETASRGMRDAAALNQILLYARHPNMLAKIEGYLASGEIHFVAVGSLHLVGEKGLVALLQKKGYQIRQL